jgi:hypothetical protein
MTGDHQIAPSQSSELVERFSQERRTRILKFILFIDKPFNVTNSLAADHLSFKLSVKRPLKTQFE